MLGTSYTDDGLVIQSTHCSRIWVVHIYPSELTHYYLSPHSILITPFLTFITISSKASFTGTPTVVIKATNISGSQYPCMMPVIP